MLVRLVDYVSFGEKVVRVISCATPWIGIVFTLLAGLLHTEVRWGVGVLRATSCQDPAVSGLVRRYTDFMHVRFGVMTVPELITKISAESPAPPLSIGIICPLFAQVAL